MNARISFTTLSPFSTDNPPLAKEKAAPTRSRIILKIDQPLVLLRL